MAGLVGTSPKLSYKDLLCVRNSNIGVSTALLDVYTGNGSVSSLSLSTTEAKITGALTVTGLINGVDITAIGGSDLSLEIDSVSQSVAVTTLDFDGTDFTITESPADDFDITINVERIQDIVGAMFSSNAETLVSADYQDVDGTIDIVVDSDLSHYSNTTSKFVAEGANISVFNNDSGFITATLTQEQVEDYAGAMVSGGTQTLITVTYDDVNGYYNFVVAESSINHDALTNFVANEHIDWTSTSSNFNTSGSITGTGVVDFGGATSVEIPSGTSVTVDAAGELALDTDGDGSTITTGVVKVYDGTQVVYVVAATNYPSSDNDVPAYDAASHSVTWQAQTGGAGGGASAGQIIALGMILR